MILVESWTIIIKPYLKIYISWVHSQNQHTSLFSVFSRSTGSSFLLASMKSAYLSEERENNFIFRFDKIHLIFFSLCISLFLRKHTTKPKWQQWSGSKLHLGICNTGKQTQEYLPPWASTPYNYILKHISASQTDYLSPQRKFKNTEWSLSITHTHKNTVQCFIWDWYSCCIHSTSHNFMQFIAMTGVPLLTLRNHSRRCLSWHRNQWCEIFPCFSGGQGVSKGPEAGLQKKAGQLSRTATVLQMCRINS